jgi:hypothetical protein
MLSVWAKLWCDKYMGLQRICSSASPTPRLPAPPFGAKLDDLELEVRTYNCLKNQWPECTRDLQRLGYKTIGQAIKLNNFGIKSLVDLLCSLEALQAQSLQASEPELASFPDEITDVLSKYMQAFKSVTRSRHPKFGEAPHKPIFLLTLLDLIESEQITRNFVPLDTAFTSTFGVHWSRYVQPETWKKGYFIRRAT